MNIAHSIRLPGIKLLFSHKKLEDSCYVGRVELQLSNIEFNPPAFLVVVQGAYLHSQRAEVFVFQVSTFLLHPQSGFPRCVHYWFTWDGQI